MADKIETSWYQKNSLPDLIIPIPLHQKRLQERGFNQALEIAKPIAKKFGLPIDYKGIQRIKFTMPQSGLAALERKRNMDNAFSISENYSGLYIALVDDVITTGCTVRECARLLVKHGAAKIDLWCAARNG